MRRWVSVFVALAVALSLVGFAVAAEEKKAEPTKAPEAAAPAKAAMPAKAAEPAKKAAPVKMAAPKAPKARQLTGTVEAVDAAAGTLTVKGRKEPVRLKAGEKVTLDKIAVGDKVLVIYSGDTASSVKKVPAARKVVKQEMKRAAPAAPGAPAKPAEPAKPAAPAAPAQKK